MTTEQLARARAYADHIGGCRWCTPLQHCADGSRLLDLVREEEPGAQLGLMLAPAPTSVLRARKA